DLRPDRLTVLQLKEIDLDLRGTQIKRLGPLGGFPIHRLYLDTQDPTLDVAPLGRILGLRHLRIETLTVPRLAPIMPESPDCKLESIAISPVVTDSNRFGLCKSLKWIGHHWDEGQRRAGTPRDEFFPKRAREPEDPTGKPVVFSRFDDFAKGLEEWTVAPAGVPGSAPAWRPDNRRPAMTGNTARGGGFFSVAGTAPADGQLWFSAPRAFLGNQSRALGGGIEFHLRREGLESVPGVPDVELASGQTRLVQVLNLTKTSGWQTVLVRLDAAAGWTVGGANGPQATAAQLRDVLANLTGLRIRASHSPQSGPATGLDDVILWDREAFERRVAVIAERERLFYEATHWAASADITPPPDQAWLPDFTKIIFEHGGQGGAPWVADLDDRHGVLLTHPPSQEVPATIKLLSIPAPADDLGFVVSARARVPQDGSRLVIKSGDKSVFEGQVDGEWREIRIPSAEFTPEEPVTIEIHAVGWNYEICFIHQPRWVRSSTLVPTAEQDGDGKKWAFTTRDPGAGWEAPVFDDSAWELGAGAFGQGAGGSDPLRRTAWQSGGIWLRRAFQSDAAPGGMMILRIRHDEDATVYLNGTPIKELAGFNTRYAEYPIPAMALKKGRNVLAIHCKHTTGDQIIDAGLTHEAPVAAGAVGTPADPPP
nr:hypothetical protein [Akkermansiaceae bacterium]